MARSFNRLSERLDEAEAAQREFVASVNHELKTPLTSLQGYGELLSDGAVPAEEAGPVVLAETARLERLVGDLLDSARMDSGTFSVRGEDVPLDRVAEAVLQRFHGTAREFSISLEVVHEPAGEALVRGDEDRLVQGVGNLVENALRCTPAGGSVHIVVQPPSTLRVADTGPGFGSEEVEHAFERFYLYERCGKDRPVGTGLGLSTVYGIVQQSGGSIDVESEVGRGTTFTIRLPRVAGAAPTHRVPASGLPRGHGEHVLVVDDDPALARITSQLIGRLGYRPEVVTDPRAAVALVEEQGLRPDLLVTDVVMPGMGGRVMVERLRRTLPALKVMYMSGYTDDATLHHGVSVDGVAFLQKPFSLADLARKVREALERPA